MNTTKALLRHHMARASEGVAYSALANCHVRGLTSIVLHDEPGNRVRLFIAHPDHKLWRCHIVNGNAAEPLPLAVHPHHCDVRFVGLLGHALNVVFAASPTSRGGWLEYDYKSAITTGAGSFTPTGRNGELFELGREFMTDCPELRADQLHTVYVPKGEPAAWLVIEGREDPGYTGRCWSNTLPVIEPDFYRPLQPHQVCAALASLLVNLQANRA